MPSSLAFAQGPQLGRITHVLHKLQSAPTKHSSFLAVLVIFPLVHTDFLQLPALALLPWLGQNSSTPISTTTWKYALNASFIVVHN